jgi:hypothetical protein
MNVYRTFAVSVAVLIAAACGSDLFPSTPSELVPAQNHDGSTPGGCGDTDAGVSDAGAAPTDAGSGPTDAGSGPTDAGTEQTFTVLCRAAWGAVAVADSKYVRHTLNRMTVHHSGVSFTDNKLAPARFRAHQNHYFNLGHADLPYHLLIDLKGNVYEGRPLWAKGDTETSYDPTGHFLVLVEGNFETQQPTAQQNAALAMALAWGSQVYTLPTSSIRGHKDLAATACPGANLYAQISNGNVRTQAEGASRKGPIRLNLLCGEAGRKRVAEIEAGN